MTTKAELMRWNSVAEDVALQILLQRPLTQDAGAVHQLRLALIGLGSLELCPVNFATSALKLRHESNEQIGNLGSYPKWTQTAIDTHILAASLGGCLDEVRLYYSQTVL